MHPHQHHHHDDEIDDHDRGLAFDLQTLISRRRALRVIAGGALSGIGLVALAGCGSDDGGTTTSSSSAASASSSSAAAAATTTAAAATTADAVATVVCGTTIPEETAGPFPGDGSNGVNVLTESGIVRSDIRSSFDGATGVAEGVPLTVTLTVVDNANGCVPLAGAAVYIWHCDRDGQYSMYADAIQDQNYLRGVQETDANGNVTFTTIYPAAYSGRWPHVHFEVYPSVADATAGTNLRATSQLALPQDACDIVYATAGYEQSVQNLASTSLDRDMVFGDGYDTQLATVTGSVDQGFVATLGVPV
jgi:protocatechuate 3,4-dioxygenase beta subunit